MDLMMKYILARVQETGVVSVDVSHTGVALHHSGDGRQ